MLGCTKLSLLVQMVLSLALEGGSFTVLEILYLEALEKLAVCLRIIAGTFLENRPRRRRRRGEHRTSALHIGGSLLTACLANMALSLGMLESASTPFALPQEVRCSVEFHRGCSAAANHRIFSGSRKEKN